LIEVDKRLALRPIDKLTTAEALQPLHTVFFQPAGFSVLSKGFYRITNFGAVGIGLRRDFFRGLGRSRFLGVLDRVNELLRLFPA
jgi:hypothetical protein